jgi:hypothetical protein
LPGSGLLLFANPDVSLLLRCLKGQLKPTRSMQENTSLCPFVSREIPHFEIVTNFSGFLCMPSSSIVFV